MESSQRIQLPRETVQVAEIKLTYRSDEDEAGPASERHHI